MKTLTEKLARIASLTELNAEPEFDGRFFQRKLAELTAVRMAAGIATVRPATTPAKPAAAQYRLRRVGGLLHWRCGRLGGSFYLARRIAAAIVVAATLSHGANASSPAELRDCMAAGNSFAACAVHSYHNESTPSGAAVFRGNDPAAPIVEQAGAVTIIRGN